MKRLKPLKQVTFPIDQKTPPSNNLEGVGTSIIYPQHLGGSSLFLEQVLRV